MASLDLSAAFDLVNVELLLTRLRIIGFPKDLVKLIEIWLTKRKYYVEVGGMSSNIHNCEDGTLQGSFFIFFYFFFNVGPPKDSIFLTTFYGLYFSHQLHMLQITILFI